MSKANSLETGFLDLLFLNTALAGVGDASGLQPSATAGSLYIALHTSSPGEAGDQTTNEAAYTNYVRKGVVRTASGWARSGSTMDNVAKITFAKAGAASSETERWVSIGTASSGAGVLLYYAPLSTAGASWAFATDDTAGDTITIPGHSLAVSDQVIFTALEGSSLPTGITEGTAYFVKTVVSETITISTTDGGSTLNITAAGAGRAWRHVPIPVSENVTPEINIGDLDIIEG